MALEEKEMYVFDRLPNYGNVQTKSTLTHQSVSPSWHSGIADFAVKMMICPTTESPFKPPSSSYSLDELPPFSIYCMEDINKGACLQNVECASEQPLSDIVSPDREQPGTDHNISAEEPSSSDQSTGEQQLRSQRRKRKSLPKDKSKSEPSTISSPSEWNTESESQTKRHKIAEGTKEKDDSKSEAEQGNHANTGEPSPKLIERDVKPAEACKQGYIHVRARRGQATDSHSLAERVRREKISERMKFLQDLVPGCNKITGKALMLDEIINYVQSLQRQVEFLSMKLEAVNPQLDFHVEGLSAKDVLGPASVVFASDTSVAFSEFHQPAFEHTQLGVSCETVEHGMESAAEAVLRRIMNAHFPSVDGYGNASSQISNVWEDDLQSVVQMGFGQNITSQCFHELFPKAI